jgi:hypothetical protein
MYANVLRGISKVRRNAETLRAFQAGAHWHDGAPSEMVVLKPWEEAAITALVIQLVALFDDALESYVSAHCSDFRGQSLGQRINHLVAIGVLTDSRSLMALRERRNELAHEADARASWRDWDDIFETVKQQLREIGATPNSLDRPRLSERVKPSWTPQ